MRRAQSALVLLLASCAHSPTPIPTPVENGGPEDCAPACAAMARMECPGHEGSPGRDDEYGTADDVSCADACVELVNADPTFTLAQRCIAQATSCKAADRCLAESE